MKPRTYPSVPEVPLAALERHPFRCDVDAGNSLGQIGDDLTTRPAENRRRQLVVGLCIVALLASGVIFAGIRFGGEREKAATPTTAGPDVTDGVVLHAVVISLDPSRSEMTIRILPEPVGSYGGLAFAKPVIIVTGTSNRLTQEEIKVDSPVSSYDVTTGLFDSQVSDYPFDNYKARLELLMGTPVDGPQEGALDSTTAGTEASPDADGIAVPTQIRVESVLHGYKIVAKPEVTRSRNFGGEVSVLTASFDVRRSGSTRFFSVFVMVLMWAIAIGVLWMTLTVMFRRRPIEVPILSMFGIVLFALPNIRNVQSGAPPIGALPDVLAFFWCESLVAACLVAMIIVFVRRASEPQVEPVRNE